jgi:uroporphyrinogen-III decarboxylase
MTEKAWAEMTPQEKRGQRLNRWLNNWGNKFPSADAEKAYKTRVQRLIDVYNVREPDRVPVSLPIGDLPLKMAGVTNYDAMYDVDKAFQAYDEFNSKYRKDLDSTTGFFYSAGQVLDILDYKLYAWPGHGIAKDVTSWQFIEGEYMRDDEYDDLIRDPTDFWIRTYMPRIFGALEPLKMLQPFTNITENVHVSHFMPLAMPQMQEMLQKMLAVGKEFQKQMQLIAKHGRSEMSLAFMSGGFAKVPFDTLADTLRGTRATMMDLYRRPDKVLKALDVLADVQINSILKLPNIDKLTMVMYPLHKGADGWMSQQAFDTFYWPPMKKVMDAFIKEGLIQSLFAEGGYNTRLEYVGDFPKGSVTWWFDRTDMLRAKNVLGKNFCLQGNVPASMIVAGSPQEVKEYCHKLIQEVGKGGGFILSAGSVPEKPKLENLYAMMEAVREYGWYKTQ